ncbi:MAG: heme utilization cystosolic carrier protein HutX [Shewanella sp.]|nr:heme utilization cystosolic carrier protein HutX [Shewanella sp.]MCF1431285.1 heme utilization cystosolic carrier protein HutX [Shewanella sp.]MCF1437790.1 heme utilization cystosolic carrier protein HutX [Shewanella sp.]MCF1457895.1 heme utilization cystosolic carrier protein HutX [Shewanella sp.]
MKNEILTRIQNAIVGSPQSSPAQLAKSLNVNEACVLMALGPEQVCWMPKELAQELLEDLPTWGPLTIIVQLADNVFEFKGDFPKGKPGHGYYNLYTKGDGLHGHLLLESYQYIGLVSRPLRGRMSHCICFFDGEGNTIFKVYLGRDKQGELLAEQVERFELLKQRLNETA